MMRIYGWKKQKKDSRDFKFQISKTVAVPKSVDLRAAMPPIYDQGQLGSCVGNGTACAVEHRLLKAGKDFTPSRLFIYYNGRVIEGTVNEDSGLEVRDGIKTINTVGACHENLFPYDITKFTHKPTPQAYEDAILHKSVKYEAVGQTENELKAALALGNPVVFGFMVKASFENAKTAKTGIYKPSGKVVGGHCVVLIGYDDAKGMFLVRNSWGKDWGLEGNFWMPYKDVLNKRISSDFWVIDVIS